MTKILAVNGSLRKKSHTKKLIAVTVDAMKAAGGEVRTLDLGETPMPMMNPDGGESAEAGKKVRKDVLWADAFLLGSPDYHGSMSAPIKNFLDYYWQEFTGKLFGYIVASHEKGLTVQDQLRTTVRQCYGWSMPYGIGSNGDADFDKEGNLTSESMRDRCEMLGRDLVVYGGLLFGQFESDLAKEPRDPGFAKKFKG